MVVSHSVSSTKQCSPKFSFGARSEKTKAETVPGPGQYGSPSVTEKYRRSASYGFGSSTRQTDIKYSGQPGPGSYTPYDPSETSRSSAFPGMDRLPKKKPSCVPPPGTYNKKSTLYDSQMTLLKRHEGKKMPPLPGPGAYMPSFSQVHKAIPNTTMDFTEPRDKLKLGPDSCAPSPDKYKALPELGGNIATRSCPNFSFMSRRRPVKSDSTPGPNFTQHSAFER